MGAPVAGRTPCGARLSATLACWLVIGGACASQPPPPRSAAEANEAFSAIQVYEARIAHAAVRVSERAADCARALGALAHAADALCVAARALSDADAEARCTRAQQQRIGASCPPAP